MAGYFDDPTPPGKHLKLTDLELAYSLNVGLDWLAETREKLQAMGFPEPLAETGERWGAFAVHDWRRVMTKMGRSLPCPEVDAIFAAAKSAGRERETS
jgi:hypothetical protein